MAKKLTKQEAVRRALQHFGNDAKPAQMKPWIKQELSIEMSTDHISTAKGSILKAQKGKPAKAAPQTAPTKKEVSTSAPRTASIPLDDILYIKALVGRVGPEPLHTLIDAFAK